MNRSESLAVLGISGTAEGDLKDAFDDIVFRTRTELLGHAGVPLWIRARVKSLAHQREAAMVLGFDNAHMPAIAEVVLRTDDAIGFLRDYEAAIATVRLRVSNAEHFTDILSALYQWLEIQRSYAGHFGKVMGVLLRDGIPASPQTKAPDTARMLQLIRKGDREEELIGLVSAEWQRIKDWAN